ncbi:MAG: gamma carbonic anhydrase family protein [Acidimicrobiales bacterium]
MALYALGGLEPRIHPSAFVHPEAVVIGNVEIGAESSVWPSAVIRGDDGPPIVIGERTSVQDGAVVHCKVEVGPTVVGSNCTIGHLAHLEGCTVHDWALVGSGATVLHYAVVESWSLVAAGAVVTPRTIVPSRALAVGVPAKIKEGAASEIEISDPVEKYLKRAQRFKAELRRIG